MSQTYSICALVEIFVFTTSYYLLSSTAHGLSQILFKQECTVFVTYFGHAWKQLKPGSIFMVTEGPRAPKEAPDNVPECIKIWRQSVQGLWRKGAFSEGAFHSKNAFFYIEKWGNWQGIWSIFWLKGFIRSPGPLRRSR